MTLIRLLTDKGETMKTDKLVKKVALLGIMGSLALVLGFLESIFIPDIPFLPVGAKPGLSNVVTMYTVSVTGLGGGIYITLIKAAFALITRGATASAMSLCGGLLSTVTVWLLMKKKDRLFSFVGIGISGALMHNLGQLTVACLISGTAALFGYGKYLIIFALVTGAVTGGMLTFVMPGIDRITKNKQYVKFDKEMKE